MEDFISAENFLVDILPKVTDSLNKFRSFEEFEKTSKLVQKGLFYKNYKTFRTFINHFFEDVKIEKKAIPKSLFKYILNSYKTNQETILTYKLIFHAFCASYDKDFELIFKFFILLVHIIGFDLKDKLILSKTTKLDLSNHDLSLIKSQEIFLELLDVLSQNKIDPNIKINNITCIEFIKNLLKQILFLGKPSSTSYQIFIKAIEIDPLLIEPITDDIIIYAMILDTHKQKETYESVIIHIIDVYSRLHRIENFVSKMVRSLNFYFNGESKALEEVYRFRGEIDTENMSVDEENINVADIFTNNILQHFSKCICNLASWQVINIFKTLLYQLQQTLNEIDKKERIHFMEIMSILLGTFLSSIRIAEHTVTTSVVEKSLRELEELRNILKQFGLALLNREHNQKLMRSFLNIAYNWAEIYIILEYYSFNNEVGLNKLADNNLTACNITYLHSYLNVKQWCLVSERITNFGETACKQLLEKLYIQKLRAMHLFEKSVNEDIIQNVIRSICASVEIMWKDILEDKYVTNNLLPKMNSSSAMFIIEKLVANTDEFETIQKKSHITNSHFIIKLINCVMITKINKLLTKRKDKIDSGIINKAISVKISKMFTEDVFLNSDPKEIVENAKTLYYASQTSSETDLSINEEKLHRLFQILEKFPVIYCPELVQKMYLIYFCSLHKTLSVEFRKGHYKQIQVDCERVIIGVLQQCKFKLVDLFITSDLCKDIVENYTEWETIFSLITENIFKDEYSIAVYEAIIKYFTENLLNPVYLSCCIIILNIANKIKKLKMSKNVKNIAEKYKTMICDKILEVVLHNQPTSNLIDGYSWALRQFLSNNEEDKISELLKTLNVYIDFALKVKEPTKSISNIMLFITVLENKTKMQSVIDEDFSVKVWNESKEKDWMYSGTDKNAQLIKLIFELTPNEEFSRMVEDLLNITEQSITEKLYDECTKKLKIWEAVLLCNLNPLKIRVIQSALQKILQMFIIVLQYPLPSENLFKSMFSLEKSIIQNIHLPLTPPMTDLLLLSIPLLCGDHQEDKSMFITAITLMESLLKFRKPLLLDRLPSFLQLYRMLLKNLCDRSDVTLNLEVPIIKEISNNSHQLEKLTKNLVLCQKDMARIAMYLVADILQQYEQITLYPSVKIHLNNCVYSLLTICDQHAIAFLLRDLSSASTEIFKAMYENYKKFYRFTGKV